MVRNIEELIDEYAQESVDNMELGDLLELAKDKIEERLLDMDENDVIKEIKDFCPHLLD